MLGGGNFPLTMVPHVSASFSNIFDGVEHVQLPFQSGVITPGGSFTSYVIAWSYKDGTPQVTSSEDNEEEYIHIIARTRTAQGWGLWEDIEQDFDTTDSETNKNFSAITFTEPATQIQLAIESDNPSVALSYLEVISFTHEESPALHFANQAKAESSPNIVSRAEWGATNDWIALDTWQKERDKVCEEKPWYCTTSPSAAESVKKKSESEHEKYPYDTTIASTQYDVSGRELIWPVNKSDHISKLFVHHTANINKDQNGDGIINAEDEKIAIRSIYYFHSVVRGWGDIGYNFLVGPTGTIYEGRYGGDFAVGAHAVWRNISSAGVSLLGNFQEEKLGTKQLEGTAKILAYLARKYGLDPTGETMFYGRKLPTILGHRDSAEASTACPGDNVYVSLDTIRSKAKEYYDAMTDVPAAAYGSGIQDSGSYDSSYIPNEGVLDVTAGETKSVDIKVVNTGTQTWDTSTYVRVDNGEPGFTVVSGEGKRAVAAYLKSGITPPGDTATFTLSLQNTMEGFQGNLQITPFANGYYQLSSFTLPVNFAKGTTSYAVSDMSTPTVKYTAPVSISASLKNIGNSTWEKTGVRAFYATVYLDDEMTTPLIDSLSFESSQVKPGETAAFRFTTNALLAPGEHHFTIVPHISGISTLLGTPLVANAKVLYPLESGVQFQQSETSFTLTPLGTTQIALPITNISGYELSHLQSLDLEGVIPNQPNGIILGTPKILEDNLTNNGKGTLVIPVTLGYIQNDLSLQLQLQVDGRPIQDKDLSLQIKIKPLQLTGALRYQSVQYDGDNAVIKVINTSNISWKRSDLTPRLQIGDTLYPLLIKTTSDEIRPSEVLALALQNPGQFGSTFQGTLSVRLANGPWIAFDPEVIQLHALKNVDNYPGLRWFLGML